MPEPLGAVASNQFLLPFKPNAFEFTDLNAATFGIQETV